MPIKYKVILTAGTLCLALFNSAAISQVVEPTTDLLSLYQQASQFDKTYLAATAQFQADQEVPKQALGGLLPTLGLTAQAQKVESTQSALGFSSSSSNKPSGYSVQLTQPLFRLQAWETYKQGELKAQIAKLTLQQANQDLLLRLSKAYFAVLAAQKDLDTLEAQKAATIEQLKSAKQNFEVGNATVTDQQEAQAKYDLIVAQEVGANNTLAVKRLELEAITGVPTPRLADLQAQATLVNPENTDPATWADQAKNGNLSAQQAQLAQLIAKREVSKAKEGHLPTLDLTAQYSDGTQQIFDPSTGRPFDVSSTNKTLGLTLNVPIYSGGITQSKVREQAALLNKARYNYDSAIINASQGAKSALLKVTGGLAQVSALQTAVQSSELALKANKTGYEVGVRINIDVLNAQQQLSSAERDLYKAKYDALVSMLELQSAVGQLDEKALAKVNTLLNTGRP